MGEGTVLLPAFRSRLRGQTNTPDVVRFVPGTALVPHRGGQHRGAKPDVVELPLHPLTKINDQVMITVVVRFRLDDSQVDP